MNHTLAQLGAHLTLTASPSPVLRAAGSGIVGLSNEVYIIIAVVGGTAALGLGILIGLRNSWKMGIGAGIGAFFGGVIFSLLIANAVGIRDMGTHELEQRGVVPQQGYYGR
ncbi:hypothetical protein PJI20_10160 [Mycobacterium kansasii]